MPSSALLPPMRVCVPTASTHQPLPRLCASTLPIVADAAALLVVAYSISSPLHLLPPPLPIVQALPVFAAHVPLNALTPVLATLTASPFEIEWVAVSLTSTFVVVRVIDEIEYSVRGAPEP